MLYWAQQHDVINFVCCGVRHDGFRVRNFRIVQIPEITQARGFAVSLGAYMFIAKPSSL